MHSSRRLFPLIVAFTATASIAACESRELGGVMPDSTFVSAMASLRRLPAASMVDSASRQGARDSILRHYRVTPAQLESAAASLASNPDRATMLWNEISRRENLPR